MMLSYIMISLTMCCCTILVPFRHYLVLVCVLELFTLFDRQTLEEFDEFHLMRFLHYVKRSRLYVYINRIY